MSLEFISSHSFGKNLDISIPKEANCITTKRKRCIFAKSENPEKFGYSQIPEMSERISFPSYREHGDRYIFYGNPEYN